MESMNDFFTNQVSHGPSLTMFDRMSLFLYCSKNKN